MATAKKKTAPKKAATKTTAKRAVAAKPVRASVATAKKPVQQSGAYSTRVQVLVTLFALLSVVFAATAYTNY